MTSKTEGGVTYDFTYSAEHAHAPATYGGDTISYDANGSMALASSPGSTHEFDVENRMARVINGPYDFTYTYDASGEMRRRKIAVWQFGAEIKETFVDGIYQETSQNCGAATSYTKY